MSKPKYILHTAVLMALITMACAPPAPAQTVLPPQTTAAPAGPTVSVDPAMISKVDAVIRSFAEADQFSGAVLIAKDGKVVLDRAYGFADREKRIRNTSSTRFYIGSLTKQFTAASILLLEERGLLSVDDPVGKHLADLPETWRSIPLRNLLTHTSGIPNYHNIRPDDPDAAARLAVLSRPSTPAEKLAYVTSQPLDFPTDTNFGYSNTNYLLLGLVVEKLSGRPFGVFLKENIFRPLHMSSTAYNVRLARPKGYTAEPGGVRAPLLGWDHVSSLGDSGISSTTHDLLKWQRALFGGKVLKPASLDKMTTAYKFNKGSLGNNGFGLVIRAPRGALRHIHHAGAMPGFNSTIAWYPDVELSVIILENLEGGFTAPVAGDMRGHLVNVLGGGEAPTPKTRREIAVGADVLAGYVGTYALFPDFAVTITLENGRLYQQGTAQPKFELYPETETRFFLKVADAQYTFIRGADGKAISLILHQDGKDMPGMKQ